MTPKKKHDFKIEQFPSAETSGTPSEFVFFGFKEKLNSIIISIFHIIGTIIIVIHIDGLFIHPLIHMFFLYWLNMEFMRPDVYKPFIVACYVGESKPVDLVKY